MKEREAKSSAPVAQEAAEGLEKVHLDRQHVTREVSLVSGSLRPSRGAILVTAPGLSEEVSLLWDSAGLQTCRPVLRAFSDAIEKQMSGELRQAARDCFLKTNDDHALPFWRGETIGIVIRELLVNAQRAIRNRGESGEIHFALNLRDDQLVIQFVDNGKGLSPAVQKALFTEGFTTKKGSEAEVSGNGLYRSRCMVEQIHSGTVSLRNQEKQSGSPGIIGAIAEVIVPLRLHPGVSQEREK